MKKLLYQTKKENDDDVPIAVTGYEGTGKSSLDYWIVRLFYEALRRKWTLEKSCIFNPTEEQIDDYLSEVSPRSVLWLDEAIDVLYKMDSMTKKSKGVIKQFTKDRSKNHIKLITIPRFSDLNENLRNHRIKFHIYCYEKGKAILLEKSPGMTGDPWNLKVGEKKFKEFRTNPRYKWKYYVNNVFQLGKALRDAYRDNFVMFLSWNKVPENDWERYTYLKDSANQNTRDKKKAERIGVKEANAQEIIRELCLEAIDDGMSHEDAMVKYRIKSRKTIYNWLAARNGVSASVKQ